MYSYFDCMASCAHYVDCFLNPADQYVLFSERFRSKVKMSTFTKFAKDSIMANEKK